MFNIKGQQMTIGTLVAIILAVLVLVFVVYGFSVGWSNLFSQLTNLGGGKVNVQTIVQSCQVACATQSTFDYCKDRSVIYNADQEPTLANCKNLESGQSKSGQNIGPTGLSRCSVITCETKDIGNCDEGTGRVEKCRVRPNPESCDGNQGILGCDWVQQQGANVGECILDKNVPCSQFNNNPTQCTNSGCAWSPA